MMKLSLTLVAAFFFLAPGLRAATLIKVETGLLRFSISADGSAELWDKKAQVAWRSPAGRLGTANLTVEGKPRRVELSAPQLEFKENGIVATFHPVPEQPAAALRVRAREVRNALEISYRADDSLKIESLSLFEELLAVTDDTKGYVVVPVREGMLIPADSGLAFEHRFDTYAYEGCHMTMLGAVRDGAAVLLTWQDPYVAATVKSVTNNVPVGSRQRLTPALTLRKSANSFRIQVLGKADYLDIAKAYRKTAEGAGWLVTWDQKLKNHPERAKLFGASNFKLWSTLDRRMNEDSSKEESVRVNWTFNESAQVAEHLKNDLKLDKVLFTLGGWIHRGYDNQHPDILPTAPECGGDAAFADCARRVMNLGYLFCLHDNYQDIYRDSPSWDEKYVMKTPDGKPARGGHWAGGTAWLTCSKMALDLAKRPQNLAAVKKLCDADSFFIDTTYASGLQECFDPAHPLTRADDMKWKQALSDYGREVFGIFGSECGREWAIPHSDFFEGLTGVSGTYYHDAGLLTKVGGTVIPLFELVYRDCIAMYGKYGYEPNRAAEYVLHHISLGRPLNYHSVPHHLYWRDKVSPDQSLALRPGIAELKQTAPREFQVTYRWAVEKPPRTDWLAFVHFTDRAGDIKFQNDHRPDPAISTWTAGEIRQGPFSVTVPEGLSGTFNVRMGLFQPEKNERAVLQGRDNGQRTYLVGRLNVSADRIDFQPTDSPQASPPGALNPFTQSDNGWTQGLHPFDCFLKNTHEVLSPLNEITAQLQMTRHEFLTPDRKVQHTVFGQGSKAVEVTINTGPTLFPWLSKTGGRIDLPPNGFLVDSPTFVAFYAANWAGIAYPAPAMFTMRSLDQRPLATSKTIRVFHAFGSDQIRVGNRTFTVNREATVP